MVGGATLTNYLYLMPAMPVKSGTNYDLSIKYFNAREAEDLTE